jgi:hypothetical protein
MLAPLLRCPWSRAVGRRPTSALAEQRRGTRFRNGVALRGLVASDLHGHVVVDVGASPQSAYGPDLPATWRCIDIGHGRYPSKRARRRLSWYSVCHRRSTLVTPGLPLTAWIRPDLRRCPPHRLVGGAGSEPHRPAGLRSTGAVVPTLCPLILAGLSQATSRGRAGHASASAASVQ